MNIMSLKIVFALAGLLLALGSFSETANAQVNFNRDIRPILSKQCTACHGPDEQSRKAGLRLDTFEGAIRDLGDYQAIVPGDADASELILRITDSDDPMPPAEHGEGLSDHEVELLTKWIKQGAQYQQHWAFIKPVSPALPSFNDDQQLKVQGWARNPMDHFIWDAAQKQNLTPLPQADPARLIRRVALDLTGLPPTQDQVNRFVANPDDSTYESIVDELLQNPAYGERWATMWLDLARYADTMGYAGDERRTIWPWRDWLIQALNENKPFDQFTYEVLAGDLSPGATERQILGTALHRNTLNNSEGGTDDEEFRTIAVKDRLSTTLNTWMGLTVRCAECHSHKFDPIDHREYYQLLDFFNQTADDDQPDDRPLQTLSTEHMRPIVERLDEEIDMARRALAHYEKTVAPAAFEVPSETAVSETENDESGNDLVSKDAMIESLKKSLQQRNQLIRVPVLSELPGSERRTTHIMQRGNFQLTGDPVTASTPKALHPFPAYAPNNRLGLARWLVAPDNPLTARVTVNRFWGRLFGTGIVATEEDFGTQGTPPSHPELLDWLATDFQSDWDTKRVIRQIVLSSTYRQTSISDEASITLDPTNRFLARGTRKRLSAEMVRDQALAVSGLLNRELYGPPVYPPQPVTRVVNAFTGGEDWITSTGKDRYRRAMYTYLKRSQPHPLFETFDMATRDVCSLRRVETNTPLQALMSLNDKVFIETAQGLARGMIRESKKDASATEQIQLGLRFALLRPAKPEQVELLNNLYLRVFEEYSNDPESAKEMAGEFASQDKAVRRFDEEPPSNRAIVHMAAMTVVANVILNMDEFLTH